MRCSRRILLAGVLAALPGAGTGAAREPLERRASPLPSVEPPPARRVRPVRDWTELEEALAAAEPGDHIVLADGRYDGERLKVAAHGLPDQPIVVRAAEPLKAKVGASFSLEGRDVWLHGLDLEGRPQRLANDRCRILRCKLRNPEGYAVIVEAGHHCRIAYNEIWHALDQHPTSGKFSAITFGSKPKDSQHCEIDHNHIHHFPFKAKGDYHAVAVSAVGVGAGSRSGAQYCHADIHHNLLESCGSAEISIKSRGNRIRHNTILGDECFIRFREGGENEAVGNWVENDYRFSIAVTGDRNSVKWNFVRSPICIFSGEKEAGTVDAGRNKLPRASDTLLVGNEGPVVIGFAFSARKSSQEMPALRTLVKAQAGEVARQNEAETVILADAGELPVRPRKLGRGEVGPEAAEMPG